MGRTRVVLVRHAEPIAHINGVVAGPKGDTGLTELGREQARRLAPRLRPFFPDRVFASTLPRGVETAQIVCEVLGWPTASQDPGLCELDPGSGDGKRWADVVAQGDAGPDQPLAPGGETLREFGTRAYATMGRLVTERLTVVAFTHGGLIAAACIWAMGLDWLAERRVVFNVDYTSITAFSRAGSGEPWVWERLNDVAHLEGLASRGLKS